MRDVLVQLTSAPGFAGRLVLVGSPEAELQTVVTIVGWENESQQRAAGPRVAAHLRDQRIDLPALMREWGVELIRDDLVVSDPR